MVDKLIDLSRDRMEKLTDFKEMNECFSLTCRITKSSF